MTEKYACVVDADNRYKTFVLVLVDASGNEQVQYYTLQEGEYLVNTAPPLSKLYAGGTGFVSPVWDNDTAVWVEGASEEEISTFDEANPAPEVQAVPPTNAELDQSVIELQLAVAELAETLLGGA